MIREDKDVRKFEVVNTNKGQVQLINTQDIVEGHLWCDNCKYNSNCGSEEQLMLIAKAVEDWHRFLAGQTEMWRASGLLDNGRRVMRKLAELHPLVTPELPRGASYDWSGNGCPNEWQRKAIAMSYGIYREILHHIAVQHGHKNVYTSPTLTCEEQGELITIKKINK